MPQTPALMLFYELCGIFKNNLFTEQGLLLKIRNLENLGTLTNLTYFHLNLHINLFPFHSRLPLLPPEAETYPTGIYLFKVNNRTLKQRVNYFN